MISGSDFVLLMAAERKLDAGEPLLAQEQRVIDTYGRSRRKLCECGCGVPLEPRVDGERHTIDDKEVNSDCYFASIGEELEKHPIVRRGVRRVGAH